MNLTDATRGHRPPTPAEPVPPQVGRPPSLNHGALEVLAGRDGRAVNGPKLGVAGASDTRTRFRVVGLETTGTTVSDAVVHPSRRLSLSRLALSRPSGSLLRGLHRVIRSP